jgi:hypothetical protein
VICKTCSGNNFNSLGKCRPCWAAYMKEYNKNNPEKVKLRNKKYKVLNKDKYKSSSLKTRYNIDLEEYQQLLIKQNYSCAICNNPETTKDNRTTQIRMLAVDHCHKTGVVRGLLCQKCNQALGLLGDNMNIFLNAIAYLER